jgi:ATP-dependent DNA ligase
MYTSTRKLSTHRFLFDLLWSDGRDHTGGTAVQRRERLQEIITPVPDIQVGRYLESRGRDLFQLAKERGLEGIIAKRKSSIYRPGKRSPDWLKIKSRPQQEFVVCGFTEGKGNRSILAHCCCVHTETESYANSVTRELDSARKDWQKRSIDRDHSSPRNHWSKICLRTYDWCSSSPRT